MTTSVTSPILRPCGGRSKRAPRQIEAEVAVPLRQLVAARARVADDARREREADAERSRQQREPPACYIVMVVQEPNGDYRPLDERTWETLRVASDMAWAGRDVVIAA